jgi:exodeoxyribonuclease VII large subunit
VKSERSFFESDNVTNSPGAASGSAPARPRIWPVGALVRAVADALEARFNPVRVRGEITGFSRAASGHCYFSLKDESGQIRCAMFKRAASLLEFQPRDGELVELSGRLGVYEPRGDLQLIVESMQRAGQGALFEQFLRLKAQLESEGLFAAERKRAVPLAPRGIGLVTSQGAAALQDVLTALSRRVPHIPVWLASASVQGAQAAGEMCEALQKLYQTIETGCAQEGDLASNPPSKSAPCIDVILLVRGGGSIEDLWAFNDERLARMIAQSPVPIISGVGHETDFTIADFVADLRAPTPTAAAELCATDRSIWLGATELMQERLQDAMHAALDQASQRIDIAAQRLSRPSDALASQRLKLQSLRLGMEHRMLRKSERSAQILCAQEADFVQKMQAITRRAHERLARAHTSLEMLSAQRVLDRGYAVLQDETGRVISRKAQTQAGQALQATLSDGRVDVKVS